MTREDVERIVREARAKRGRPDLSWANLREANLREANLREANLHEAHLHEADLSGADLREADLRWADLHEAHLHEADLSGADLRWADLSNASGLLDPIDWMAENLEACADGYFAYKVFGLHYMVPDYWNVEAGEILSEVCHPDRTLLCACGINLGTFEWIQKNAKNHSYWKVLIRWPWLAGVVVPYNTGGKFRCSRCELVEEVRL